ncbi:MAG: class I SAM-dependent methyltransferase [Cyanobacteria bacterium P01_A01_bin.17]
MVMQLNNVVPFGRSFDEYQQIFDLSSNDLSQRILGVGDGPASFNAEATEQGFQVTSIDPIYTFNGAEIQQRFDAVVDDIIAQVKSSPDDWVWSYHRSPEHLRRNREQVMQLFRQDYESGKQAGRYLVGELPNLPFADDQFDLALCSHFLFLYSDHVDEAFHHRAIHEMLRVSPEVRIFPLLTLMLEPSPYLESIVQAFKASGHEVSLTQVAYELQKGGNQMLVIRRHPL